ncbi:MAG: hypothetical protein AAGD32_18340, partial [Planctomycetota bacterium]
GQLGVSWPEAAAEAIDVLVIEGGWRLLALVLFVAAYPWLCVGALLIFQQTLRRAGVGVGHVLRAGLYGADMRLPILIGGLMLIAFTLFDPRSAWDFFGILAVALLATFVLTVIGLTIAQAMYLRLPHTYRTALSIHVMLFLLLVIVILQIGTRT